MDFIALFGPSVSSPNCIRSSQSSNNVNILKKSWGMEDSEKPLVAPKLALSWTQVDLLYLLFCPFPDSSTDGSW